MRKKQMNEVREILGVVLLDVETLIIDFKKPDNKYYYNLIRNNLKDIILRLRM